MRECDFTISIFLFASKGIKQGLFLGFVSTSFNDSALAYAMTSAHNCDDHGKKMFQNTKEGNKGIITMCGLFFSFLRSVLTKQLDTNTKASFKVFFFFFTFMIFSYYFKGQV